MPQLEAAGSSNEISPYLPVLWRRTHKRSVQKYGEGEGKERSCMYADRQTKLASDYYLNSTSLIPRLPVFAVWKRDLVTCIDIS